MEENEVLENEIIEEQEPEVIEEHAPNSEIINALNKAMAHKVYIKVDSDNNITYINSDTFINDYTDTILIDTGIGDKYAHSQHNYLDKPLVNDDGTYNYKYVDNKIVAN